MAYSCDSLLELALPTTTIVQLADDEHLCAAGLTLDGAKAANPKLADRIAHAQASADSLIDMYARGRYSVPLSPVPVAIAQLATDLAVVKLYGRRAAEFGLPDAIEALRDVCDQLLMRLSQGLIDLGVEPTAPASARQVATVTGATPLFTADTMADY